MNIFAMSFVRIFNINKIENFQAIITIWCAVRVCVCVCVLCVWFTYRWIRCHRSMIPPPLRPSLLQIAIRWTNGMDWFDRVEFRGIYNIDPCWCPMSKCTFYHNECILLVVHLWIWWERKRERERFISKICCFIPKHQQNIFDAFHIDNVGIKIKFK